MAPFDLHSLLGTTGTYLVYLMIGVAFGAVLEMAGFGNTRKLAAQFYFKDLTVLKVMFTAIIVAMVLIFWTSGLSILDYSRVWVNPTYLWPGIVGGLIMGFGFIIGGFCPGTSLVALATLKLDGLMFALGVMFGIFTFGETVSLFEGFWNSSYMGRFTLPNWLGLSTGSVVMLVVLMALFMFWGGEQLERIFGGKTLNREPRMRYAGAVALLLLSVAVMGIGQPSIGKKWQRIASDKEPLLRNREVQIHPGELAALIADDQTNVMMIDLRPEADYNLFHIRDARPMKPDQVSSTSLSLLEQPPNTAVILMDNDELRSTEVWKRLVTEQVPNVYILEGGINYWLDVFGHAGHERCPQAIQSDGSVFRHVFDNAIGDRRPASEPDLKHYQGDLEYTKKVKLELKRAAKSGGCG